MEIDGIKYKIAYYRENFHTDQAELSFNIDTSITSLGNFAQDITAVRQRSDTISSLLGHINNKVIKYLKETFPDEEKLNLIENLKISCNLHGYMNTINNGTVLRNFPVLFRKYCHVLFEIFDQKYVVTCNAPLVKQISLPAILYANFSIQPRKFQAIFTENKFSIFIWYKSVDKVKWKEVGRGFYYFLQNNDVGHYIKLLCIPKNQAGLKGPAVEVVSEEVVEKIGTLPRCPFEDRHEFTREKLTGDKFRVVSYNILSEKYTNIDENFNYCQQKFLATDYRKQLIVRELLGYNADIICLQEVDNRHYSQYFKNQFKEKNYSSFYHRKGNRIPEGLAIFFNKNRFKEVEVYHIVFSSYIREIKSYEFLLKLINLNADLKNDFFKQSTSFQVTVLKMKDTDKFIIVGNTHLYYHPDAAHIRLLQAFIATSFLTHLKKKYEKTGMNVSVIFCGDFNSSPKRSLLNFMLEGRINSTHEDCLKINKDGKTRLYHEFIFESSCGVPKYTNYTPDFKDCLDYIFIESNKMAVEQIVPLTGEEELSKYEGLPNEFFPSDHLALVVDLKFKY